MKACGKFPRASAQGYGCRESQVEGCGLKADALGQDVDFVRVAGIIESGTAGGPKRHGPSHHLHAPNHLMLALPGSLLLNGHVVDDFRHAGLAEEARDQNVGVRPVKLFQRHSLGRWSNLESAAFFVIEDCGKDAGLIEVGKAKPIDRSVHPHQRDGVHVADDPVIFNWLVAHEILFSAGDRSVSNIPK